MPASVQIVRVRNPWPDTVPDGVFLSYLSTAACDGLEHMQDLVSAGTLSPDRDSFACVLLDPTGRVVSNVVKDFVIAIVLIGPNAERLVPNAAAKADAHLRHWRSNGDVIEDSNYCLSDGEFAWGYSVDYAGAPGGGSGLSDKQDRDVANTILASFFEKIHDERERFIRDQRAVHGSWGWYNNTNTPDPEYQDVVTLLTADGVITTDAGEPATSPR
jgi:hypothetical protein